MLELCSGCGGMSLGLKTAGFELRAHVECDPLAAATYAVNFGPTSGEGQGEWARPRDMNTCSPETLAREFGLHEDAADSFDILAAGLPCQAFARIGRSKLRSIAGDKKAFKKDQRATLYKRFLEYVSATRPLGILIENVPDILNFGGHNVPEEICGTLDSLGYRTAYTLLNAAFYGVPQLRERLILLGIDVSLGVEPRFPDPTHSIDLPSGYEGSRNVALKYVPDRGSHFRPIPGVTEELPQAVSVRSALRDLPFISEHFTNPTAMKRRRVCDHRAYRKVGRISDYARAMRDWPGFEGEKDLDAHVVRVTPRDFEIFKRMPHGSDYPIAIKIAEGIFAEKLEALSASDVASRIKTKAYRKLRSATVPPYDPGKFPNKWWKLAPSCPSRTLTAHIGKDTYSHIHYDSRQKRTISVREAARLQSFPDGFRFAGQMNAAFRQIGNAVPPLLALAVARVLKETLLEGAAMSKRRKSTVA